MSGFQVMPGLADDEYAALKADIEARGVVVPVVVDQHDHVLDGHHRRQIAAELGIACPTETRHVGDDEERRDVAFALNLARRHLTREQKRELIAAEIDARPDDSDRAIGRRVGCSPTTVGGVRAERRDWAERCSERIRANIEKGCAEMSALVFQMHREHQIDWQSVGDFAERTALDPVHEEFDDEEIVTALIDIYGPFFDSVRAVDCAAECSTCTPEDRRWRDEHPERVYRHTDPPELSNLDSSVGW